MGNRVSSSIVTTDRRNFEIIEERKAHYPIRKRQIGIRQKFFNRSVYTFFFLLGGPSPCLSPSGLAHCSQPWLHGSRCALANYDAIGRDETVYSNSKGSKAHNDLRHGMVVFGSLRGMTPSEAHPIYSGRKFDSF
jgi:hypothetical protein